MNPLSDDLLRILERERQHGLSLAQLEKRLGLSRNDRPRLRKLLDELRHAGSLIADGDTFRPQHREGGPPRQGKAGKAPKQGREAPDKHQAAPDKLRREGSEARRDAPQGRREGAQGRRDGAQGRREAAPAPREPAAREPAARGQAPAARREAAPAPGRLASKLGPGMDAARAAAAGERGGRKGPREMVGILHLKPEGYGFLSPLLGGTGRADDLFIPPRRALDALDGDIVRARASKGRDGRSVGDVIEIIERRRLLALGTYRLESRGAAVEPRDRALPLRIAVPRDPRAKDGDLVKIRLIREENAPLAGEVTDVLVGGEARAEILAVAYAAGFSDEFDQATELAAAGVPDRVRPEDTQGRRDLRHLPLVTIDGEDARDFDDAIHVSRAGAGYRLVVAIADVAHYVRPSGPLDREGLRRATSVYFPGTVLPMLPERLSNGICSLNPDVDRLCMVCDLALTADGQPLHADIYEAVMRSHARLTYTQVAAVLGGANPPELRPLLPDLHVAGELAKKMTATRRARGSIDFDLPETKVVLAPDGSVKELVRRPRNDAHRLVEEFMLGANEAVARFFDARGLPTVYRIHDQPDEEKLESFATLARSHGFALPEGKDLTPRVLNQFLAEVEGKPQQKALNSLLLRAMMQAVYSPDNIGHFGLAAPTYLHFTSPIRRYPDLMVHRLLKEHWARGGQPPRAAEREEQETVLAGVAAQCSERERASMKAEREIDAYYAAVYMRDRVGEEFGAVVASVAEFGLFCELKDVFVEGLIPAEDLGSGVEFDAELHRLKIGSSGRSYGVGDELQVELVSSDPGRRRITLGLLAQEKSATVQRPGRGAASGRPAHAGGRPALAGGTAPQAASRAGKRGPREHGGPPQGQPGETDRFLRVEDLVVDARPAPKKPLRKGQSSSWGKPPQGQKSGRPGPGRGSPPGQKSRQKGRRGRGR